MGGRMAAFAARARSGGWRHLPPAGGSVARAKRARSASAKREETASETRAKRERNASETRAKRERSERERSELSE